MFDFDAITQILAESEMVRGVDQAPKGHVRIETALLYPDGASVDLFASAEQNLYSGQTLTDFGQTTAWLLDLQVRPWKSKKRQRFLEDAIRVYGVKQNGGALEKYFNTAEELKEGILALGQACVRVADLTYTRRSSMQSAFSEEVEEFLCDTALDYESNVELGGKYGSPVRVDYLVTGATHQSAILSWSTRNTSAAHTQANEIFRRWYDLATPNREEARVTILDDRFDVYKDEDLNRIRDYSDIITFSDKDALVEVLAA